LDLHHRRPNQYGIWLVTLMVIGDLQGIHMSKREIYERNKQAQLEELKAEIAEFRGKVRKAEINLELEYYTLVDQLQLKLEETEHRFELLRMVNEEKWEEFKSQLEKSSDSLRELIKAITAP
jgi:hypothetical protein